MTTEPLQGELVPVDPAASGGLDQLHTPAARLVSAFLAGRSERTTLGYRRDLVDFARFLGAADPAAAAARLLAAGGGPGNGLALDYKADMLRRELSPATINRRLSALRSLVRLGRVLGLATWSLETQNLRALAYRDTAGPGVAAFRKVLGQLAGKTDFRAVRDRCILRLTFDLALRRAEVSGLDLADVDLERGTLLVVGKGHREKVKLSLPAPTRTALAEWLAVRGQEPGPLLWNAVPGRHGERLSGNGIWRIVTRLGQAVGVVIRPHMVRHTSLTAALDAGLDIRTVQRFSRHQDIRVLMRYDDNRQDLAGQVAARVAAEAA